jgi:hypothetical protein
VCVCVCVCVHARPLQFCALDLTPAYGLCSLSHYRFEYKLIVCCCCLAGEGGSSSRDGAECACGSSLVPEPEGKGQYAFLSSTPAINVYCTSSHEHENSTQFCHSRQQMSGIQL